MAALLSLLVILVSAALAALLAWSSTRARFALLAFVALAMSSGGTLAAVLSQDDGLDRSASETALVPNSGPAQASEVPAAGVDPAAMPSATPVIAEATQAPLAVASGSPLAPEFALEAASAEGGFASPTSFAIGDSGELYVGHDSGIVLTRDTNGDGFYDSQTHFGLEGGWVFGLDYHNGRLYAAVQGNLLRLTDLDGDDIADEVITLAEGLPHNRYGGHSNSGIVVGPDGLLYMTVGGTSDHGPELEPLGGTILTLSIDEGLAGSPLQLHATGLRNPYDLGFCPDGRLYASDNGPDQLDQGLISRPWDEVNLILPGGNYGYPDYFGPVPLDTGTISPIARLAPSAGATGIVCYSGAAYPVEYAGNLFVTLWGTFTFPVESGRRVMRVQIAETPDGPIGLAVEFVRGLGHPIDILEDPAGHLLVLDYERGQIVRIRYNGLSPN